MKTKRWVIADPDEARVRALSEEGGYAPLTAAVLVARGIDTPEAAADYLSCHISGLYDPFLLTDMDKAVAVIRGAIARGEHIVVYGGLRCRWRDRHLHAGGLSAQLRRSM